MRQTLLLTIIAFLLPWPSPGQIQFSEVTTQSGLAFTGKNYGASTVDYNQDGWEDIFAISHDQPCRLYHNNGNGSFTDVAPALGIDYVGTPNAAGWADINNDGFLDLLIANRNENNVLYLGKEDGTFVDHTFLSGLLLGGKVRALLFSDVNLDGLIDIYLARINRENIFYLNVGNGQFINFTSASGALDDQISMGAVFFDYDNDGDPDLYLTHDADQPNILYQNDGSGFFTDVSKGSGANIGTNGMGVDVADVNQDGWLDIYVTNLSYNSLLINNGDGTFYETGQAAGVGDPGMGWGCTFVDIDNDGWQDIYAANDSYFTPLPNVLYQNQQELTFEIISENTPLESMQPGYGVASLDFDNDGSMDIYLTNYVGEKGNQMFRNDFTGNNNWIKLKLKGTTSNRNAIGARVLLETGEIVLIDEIMGTSGYATQNSFILHFGLGQNERVHKLTIRWPNGLLEVFEDLPVNTIYNFIEGDGSFTTSVNEEPLNNTVVNVFPNPFSDQLNVESSENKISRISVLNIFGELVETRNVEIPANNYRLNIKNKDWPSGLYFLKLEMDNRQKILRIIKD
ncbi:MAG: FG-GAP-like repeat-containing protein [Bacteroidota bacterium]